MNPTIDHLHGFKGAITISKVKKIQVSNRRRNYNNQGKEDSNIKLRKELSGNKISLNIRAWFELSF